MKFDLSHALASLYPNSACAVVEDDYTLLRWQDPDIEKPAESVLRAEAARLQAAWDAEQYKRQRVAAYPPIEDYIDGIVKGDEKQVEEYILACLAVKARYPKPE